MLWYSGCTAWQLQSLEAALEKAAVKTGGLPTGKLSCATVALRYFLAGGSSSFAAILTSSANDSAFIFRIAWPRWIFPVISLGPSSAAIFLLSIAETTQTLTS